jgi:hypothetical protein
MQSRVGTALGPFLMGHVPFRAVVGWLADRNPDFRKACLVGAVRPSRQTQSGLGAMSDKNVPTDVLPSEPNDARHKHSGEETGGNASVHTSSDDSEAMAFQAVRFGQGPSAARAGAASEDGPLDESILPGMRRGHVVFPGPKDIAEGDGDVFRTESRDDFGEKEVASSSDGASGEMRQVSGVGGRFDGVRIEEGLREQFRDLLQCVYAQANTPDQDCFSYISGEASIDMAEDRSTVSQRNGCNKAFSATCSICGQSEGYERIRTRYLLQLRAYQSARRRWNQAMLAVQKFQAVLLQ